MEIDLSAEHEQRLPTAYEHQPVELTCRATDGATLALTVDGQRLDPFLRPGETTWRWRWNPGAAVGLHDVRLYRSAAGEPDRLSRWELRVAPAKLDQERYEALIEDLERVAHALAYALGGTGAEGAALEPDAPWERSRLEEYYALFEERLEPLARATRRIAERPREQLRGATVETPLGEARELDADVLRPGGHHELDPAPPGVAEELAAALGLRDRLPRRVPVPRGTPTLDTYEHRLLRRGLTVLLRRARFIGAVAAREAGRLERYVQSTGGAAAKVARVRQIEAGCGQAIRALRELLALPLFGEVGQLAAYRGPTPLLQRDPAYREILRAWQALHRRALLNFDSPLFYLPVADLPQLYETWCALQTARALLALGEVRSQRLVAHRDAGDGELTLVVELPEDEPLVIVERADVSYALRYQPRYRPTTDDRQAGYRTSGKLASLDRYTHVPDLAIEVTGPGAVPRVLVLDAKYRLDAEGRGVPPDALADGYTYLGAVGWAGRRATIGALLLYPGRGAPELFQSGVGAVPLLPGRAEALAETLHELLA